MRTKKLTAARVTALCLLVILIFGLIAEQLQTDGGNVQVQPLQIQTVSGNHISADLYIPDGTSAENPRPTVIVTHGRRKSKEEYESVAIELSRRGFVVMNYDMYGHGDSTDYDNSYIYNGLDAYDVMAYTSTLPFVDKERIGVTGQSSGAKHAFDFAWDMLAEEDCPYPQYAALMFVGSDPTYVNGDKEYYNKYGSVPIGVVAATCDDWYYMNKTDYLHWGNLPRDWVYSDNAKSFFTWGGDPAAFEGNGVVPGEYYYNTVDGTETFRIVWTPNEVHSYNMLSMASTAATVEFFTKALDVETSLANDSQVFYWREWCLRICTLFFFIFVGAFTLTMVDGAYFKSLATEDIVQPRPTPAPRGKMWWWGGIIATAILGGFLLIPCTKFGMNHASAFFPTDMSMALGLWGALVGLFSLLLCVGNYVDYGKKAGFSLKDTGVVISGRKLAVTVVLAVLVAFAAYTLITMANFLFNINFRVWAFNIPTLNLHRISIALRYLPLFLVCFVASSVSINCFRYNGIGGKWKYGNIAILTIFNILGVVVFLGLQYGSFFIAGEPMFHATRYAQTAGTANYGTPITMAAGPLISRAIYKKTNNPYLGGIIMAILVALISSASAVASF